MRACRHGMWSEETGQETQRVYYHQRAKGWRRRRRDGTCSSSTHLIIPLAAGKKATGAAGGCRWSGARGLEWREERKSVRRQWARHEVPPQLYGAATRFDWCARRRWTGAQTPNVYDPASFSHT